jgi:hypothetical protein
MPTINESVAAGADDGMVARFGTYLLPLYASTTMLLSYGSPSSQWWPAIRFDSVAVPPAATITSASLSIVHAGGTGSPVGTIYGNDVDSAPAWGSANRVLNIAKTTASASLDTVNSTSVNDVTGIIQEIISRGGWASGNAIAFGIFQQANGGNWRGLTFESGSPPTLDITYTEGGGVTAVPVFYHHLRQQGIA